MTEPDGGLARAPHACKIMAECLPDPRIPIDYDPRFREYDISVQQPGEGFVRAATLFFCPWCGVELPSSLREELYAELEALYGDDAADYFFDVEKVPTRFRTDAWWQGSYD